MKQQQKILFESQVAEIELVYKSKVKATDRPLISGAVDAARYLQKSWNPNTIQLQEQFKVMYLNRAHRVLGIYPMSTGGMTGTVVDCRLIVAAAIRLGATAFLICHNHPAESLKPSQADINMTTKIQKAAALFDMALIDHLIITRDSYYSFREGGIL